MKKPVVPIEQLCNETRELCDVLNDESDLACIVIGAAFLDEALVSLLTHRFIASSVSDKLLAPNGAVGSFVARADLAYALALIKKSSTKTLASSLRSATFALTATSSSRLTTRASAHFVIDSMNGA
jgi:hypothetical protein